MEGGGAVPLHLTCTPSFFLPSHVSPKIVKSTGIEHIRFPKHIPATTTVAFGQPLGVADVQGGQFVHWWHFERGFPPPQVPTLRPALQLPRPASAAAEPKEAKTTSLMMLRGFWHPTLTWALSGPSFPSS